MGNPWETNTHGGQTTCHYQRTTTQGENHMGNTQAKTITQRRTQAEKPNPAAERASAMNTNIFTTKADKPQTRNS